MIMGMGKRGQLLLSEFEHLTPTPSDNGRNILDEDEKTDSEIEEEFESLVNQIDELNADKFSDPQEHKVSGNSCNDGAIYSAYKKGR